MIVYTNLLVWTHFTDGENKEVFLQTKVLMQEFNSKDIKPSLPCKMVDQIGRNIFFQILEIALDI